MNTDTGEIVREDEVKRFSPEFQKLFVPVERDLTFKERMEQQIGLYADCGCGSGKKFKFCCHTPRAK